MIAVIQRVKRAVVVIDGKTAGECGKGLMVLLGVAEGDTGLDAELLAAKMTKLRIFSDDSGKMNLSVKDVDGEMLVVSNFTLAADYSHGNRPNYLAAAAPDVAESLYDMFVHLMEARVKKVATGKFGADMRTEMKTDGPVTIVMYSSVLRKK